MATTTAAQRPQLDSAVGSMDDLFASKEKSTPLAKKLRQKKGQHHQQPREDDAMVSAASQQARADSPTSSAKKEGGKELGAYSDTLAKRVRAMKKRVERIEKYEEKAWDTLNPDQRESLALLPALRHTARELEDLQKVLEAKEAEDATAAKRVAKAHAREVAAAAKNARGEAHAEALKQLHGYIQLVRELEQLDAEDPVVARMREIFLPEDPAVAEAAIRKVLEKSSDEVFPGITYADAYQRLIEAPLRVEDLLAPVEFMVDDAANPVKDDENEEEKDVDEEGTELAGLNEEDVIASVLEEVALDEPKLSFLSGEDFMIPTDLEQQGGSANQQHNHQQQAQPAVDQPHTSFVIIEQDQPVDPRTIRRERYNRGGGHAGNHAAVGSGAAPGTQKSPGGGHYYPRNRNPRYQGQGGQGQQGEFAGGEGGADRAPRAPRGRGGYGGYRRGGGQPRDGDRYAPRRDYQREETETS